MNVNREIVIGDYVIIDTQFEVGVYEVKTNEQVEQANLDDGIALYDTCSDLLITLVNLTAILNKLENSNFNDCTNENMQRVNLIKSNIKMMLRS